MDSQKTTASPEHPPPLQEKTLPAADKEETRSLLAAPAGSPAPLPPPPEQPGELGRLGNYRLLQVLGEGGMGTVYLAEDIHLQRVVALKVMKPEIAAQPRARERFLREGRAMAAVQHDHVAHVNQVNEDGIPFLAMPYLEGETLEVRLKREQHLPVAEVVRIGREIALGLAAAHARGLIHRDIKPGNIWLEGERGRVKILDFGLARAVVDDVHLTQPGAVAGTPAYMAPEQANGAEVDQRSDLFSLGCVLYRMGTGALPFRGTTAMQILRALELEQPRPPRELNADVPAALSDLVMRLLAKDPAQRPSSAQAVAEALAKVDDSAPIPPPVVAVRRKSRWPLGTAAVLLATILGLGLWFLPALLHPLNSDAPSTEPTEPEVKSPFTGLDALDSSQIPAAERFDWQPKELVAVIGEHRQRHWGPVGCVAIRADGKQAASSGLDGIRFWDMTTQRELPEMFLDQRALAVAYAPDGKRLATSSGRRIHLWEVVGGKLRLQTIIPEIADEYLTNVAFSADGKSLCYSSSVGNDKTGGVWLWDVSKVEPRLRAHYPKLQFVSISPDCKTLAAIHAPDQTTNLYDLSELQPKRRGVLPGKEGKTRSGFPPVFAPDGRLATQDLEGIWRLWDLSGREPQVQTGIKQPNYSALAFSGDGKRLVTSSDYNVQLWSWDGVEYTPLVRGLISRLERQGNFGPMALSPDGRTLVTGQSTGAIRFWEVGADSLIEKSPVKPQPVSEDVRAVVLPGSPALAATAEDGRLRVWRLDGATFTAVALPGKMVLRGWPLAVARDGKMLATTEGQRVQLWHVEGTTFREADVFKDTEVPATCAAFGLTSKTLALGNGETISLWDLSGATPKMPVTSVGAKGGILGVTFSPDGRTLVSVDHKVFRTWNVNEGKITERGQNPFDGFRSLTVTPDSQTLVLASWAFVGLWNLGDGRAQKPARNYDGSKITSAALSPDGQSLVVATAERSLVLWDIVTRQKLWEWTSPGAVVWEEFAPDGRHLFTANSNGTIYVLRLTAPP